MLALEKAKEVAIMKDNLAKLAEIQKKKRAEQKRIDALAAVKAQEKKNLEIIARREAEARKKLAAIEAAKKAEIDEPEYDDEYDDEEEEEQ